MKRIAAFAAAFFIVISCLSVPALAVDENHYHFSDTSGDAHNEVDVTIPKEFLTITPDMKPGDPGYDAFSSELDGLRKHNIYLLSFPSDGKSTIAISMFLYKGTSENLNSFSDKEIQQFQQDMADIEAKNGDYILSNLIYSSDKQKYVKIHLRDSKGSTYQDKYITVINKYILRYEFISSGQDLIDSQATLLKHIVDTAEYSPKASLSSPATPAATAKDIEYRLEELGVSVSFPNSLIILTRDIKPDDPNLAKLGRDAKDILSVFNSNHIYLDAISNDRSYEYTVKMSKPDPVSKDFNLITDKEILKIAEESAATLKGQGATDISSDIYHHAQISFIHAQFVTIEHSTQCYNEVYTTLADGKLVTVKFTSYGTPITSGQETTLKHIIDSITFNKLASAPPSVAPAKSTSVPYNQIEAAKISNPGAFAIGRIVGTLVFLGIVAGIIARITVRVRSKKDTNPSASIPIWTEEAPASLNVSPQTQNPPAPETPAGILTCPTCGMKNQNDRLVCYRCGHRLQPEPKAEETAEDETDESFRI